MANQAAAIPIAPQVTNAVALIEGAAQSVNRAVREAEDNPADLARVYIQLRSMLDSLDAATRQLTEVRDRLNTTLIPESYEMHKVTSQTIDGHRITVTMLVRASIMPDQKQAAHQWLRDQGYDGLVIETVNASALASLAKTLMQEEGTELPEATFKTFTVPSVSMTKVK